MIYTILLLLFFIYSFVLFFINSFWLLSIILLSNLFFIVLQGNLKKYLKTLKGMLPFILFIFLCSLLFSSLIDSLLVSYRLLIALHTTVLISKILTTDKITLAFYYLFYPLKLFKINIRDLSLSITITLTFLPILMDEAKDIKLALQSKGFDFNFKNAITKPQVYILTFINSLFNRIQELEKALMAKAFS